ncbi:hypothetical protein [Hymenobacter chitinivorans]|uniref:Uncharacterized protein n=1 Tax=Hymenobacter chitinivorans DSM 11115 TaxID=1121954 RepID=A0A2M9BQ48_9BACT|nr:hypothetical protein [Hymenobacter chitinivorans]PJJ60038.1 hypothetical protein CLV45_1463 [Hymenobacter chitinivorans DSM 11115]
MLLALPASFNCRVLALLLLALLAPPGARAKCMSTGLSFWPRSQTIRQNSLLVVDAYYQSQVLLTGLGTTHEAFLRAGDQRIPLEVVQLLPGEFAVTQAVLRPRRQLEVGKQYEVVIVAAGKKATGKTNLVFQHHRGKAVYTVVAGQDDTAPQWLTLPTEKGQQYQEFGCGPEVSVDFMGRVQDDSEYLVKATVQNLTTGQATSYYLHPDEQGTIYIGHGMCGGAFRLQNGKSYSVTCALMDAAGNTTAWTQPALPFTAPVPNHKALVKPEPRLPGE